MSKSYFDVVDEILTSNGEDINLRTLIKNAKPYWKRFFKNYHNDNNKAMIFNPYSGKKELVEDWISFFHYEIISSIRYFKTWTDNDAEIYDTIIYAIRLYNSEIYYDYFD